MNGQKPTKKSWEEIKEELEISVANTEKRLTLMKAQLKLAEGYIKK